MNKRFKYVEQVRAKRLVTGRLEAWAIRSSQAKNSNVVSDAQFVPFADTVQRGKSEDGSSEETVPSTFQVVLKISNCREKR